MLPRPAPLRLGRNSGCLGIPQRWVRTLPSPLRHDQFGESVSEILSICRPAERQKLTRIV
jgi:hypothetical protein